jgi:ribonuclease HI
MGKKKVYAVASGRTSGVIVSSWDECKDLVHGYTGAKFKSFSTREDAQQYLNAAVSTSLSSLSNKNNNKSIGTPSLAATLTTGLAVKVEQQQQQPIKRKTGVVTSAPAQQQAAAPAAASSIIENPYRKRVKLEDGVDQTTTRVAAIPPTSNRIRVHIMFDGGARGNPGIAGAGAMVSLQTVPHSTDAAMPTHHVRCYVGDKSTNNVAEYSGLVQGLAMAKEMVSNYHLLRPQHSAFTTTAESTTTIGELVVQGDSNLIIQQLNGIYKVKNAKLKELFGQVQDLLQKLRRLGLTHQVYEHVYRDGNKVADGTYFRIERPYESGWNGSPPNSLRSLFPRFVCLLVGLFSIGQRGHGRTTIMVYDQCRQSPGAMGHGRIMTASLCCRRRRPSFWMVRSIVLPRAMCAGRRESNKRETKWIIRYRRDYGRTWTHLSHMPRHAASRSQ